MLSCFANTNCALGPRDPTTLPSQDPSAAKLSEKGGDDVGLVTGDSERPKCPTGPDTISLSPLAPPGDEMGNRHRRVLSFSGVEENHQGTSVYKHSTKTEGLARPSSHQSHVIDDRTELEEEEIADSDNPYYLNRHTTGRNAQFHSLTRAEREHLGGVEYRALTFLSILVPAYWFLWQVLGCLGLAAYFAHNKPNIPLENGINPWYASILSNECFMANINSGGWVSSMALVPLITRGCLF